jgi:hypothetical protein
MLHCIETCTVSIRQGTRADDQLQRNHSTQYVSQPDFTWQRLRKRILRRSRTRRMDEDQDRGRRHQGQPLRQWRRPALPDCERSEIGRNSRSGCALDRLKYGGIHSNLTVKQTPITR